MNWALIALNALVYLLQQVPFGTQLPWYHHYVLTTREPQLLNYFTYAFLHGSPMHLIGNMLFLYVFGNNVNDKMGHLGYLAYYLAGGVFAGIAYVLTQGGDTSVIGASGAIAAVTGAYLVLFPQSHVTLLIFFYIVGTYEIASFWFIAFFFAQDLVLNHVEDSVAHMAHIGGTVFGCAICLTLLATGMLPRDQFDVVALIKQWNRRRQYRDAVSSGWNPYLTPVAPAPSVNFRRTPPPPPDPRQAQITDLRAEIAESVASHDLPRAADRYLRLKNIDKDQVLSRQAQLDVANQLAGQQLYPQAVEAYELFLRHYPKFEQIEQVELMLGIIYARYILQYLRARELLVKASARLHGDRELSMARTELAQD